MCLPDDLFNFNQSLWRAQRCICCFFLPFLIIKFIPILIAIIKNQIIQIKKVKPSPSVPFKPLSKGNKVTMATNNIVIKIITLCKNKNLPLNLQRVYRVLVPPWAPVCIMLLRLCYGLDWVFAIHTERTNVWLRKSQVTILTELK